MMIKLFATAVVIWLQINVCYSIELSAQFSQEGLHGSISWFEFEGGVHIVPNISTDLEWSWSIHQFPVVYTDLEDRCDDKKLGNLDIDLTSLFGHISNATTVVSSSSSELPLIGKTGIWTKSILLKSTSGARACSTIFADGSSNVKVAEAYFPGEHGIGGKVLFQWFGSPLGSDAAIYTDLKHVERKRPSQHQWRIYTTDILDSEADKARSDCNSLQVVLIDLTEREGSIKVGDRLLLKDSSLPQLDLTNSQRIHYLVLIDNLHPDTFLVCSKIEFKEPTLLRGIISSHGVSGGVELRQQSELTPTKVIVNITTISQSTLGGFRIHALPAIPPVSKPAVHDWCRGIGDVYNPTNKGIAGDAPIPGEDTQDKYAVGDLSGKIGYSSKRTWDLFLPLTGKFSVALRSIVLYRNGDEGVEVPWVCTMLTRYSSTNENSKVLVRAAEVTYRYPLVGRILFFQPEPYGETTILVEGLVHADGTSLNTTHEHRWGIHVNPPGKDFFNWTARCVSAGPVFNPYKVNVNSSTKAVVGALSERLGHLTIAGSKKFLQTSRILITDPNIALYGLHSILGMSLVIFDDFGPKARGERLACSKIMSLQRRKAVARDWFGNGFTTKISGKIEFYQQTDYGISDIELNLDGLTRVGNYHIHLAPVLEILEFPCEDTTLYGIYNPYNVNKTAMRSTLDEFEAGDLSGKFGSLMGHTSYQRVGHNDSTLMLFGQRSILGRSIVFHDDEKNSRLACATIERGYAPSEAREIRAITSFHHPLGFAYGYIRMTQLIHSDGSQSDTVIEVNLRHPGKQNRNITLNHNWAIYVNPVGVDASVKVLHTRCTAAGYIWNPYYTQLADPLNDELYRQECGTDLPLRCYVGDLSGRLGPIDLGRDRYVFSDPNFPLEGAISAMGRSIVIFNKDGRHEKFACANIEPDFDTVKYVNVRRPPKFVVSQFLEEVRAIMGIPDWFLTIDSRKTNILYNGACIQLFVHFKGPQANKLEQDFSRLLASGKLASPSLAILGYTPKKRPSSTSYKLCPSSEKNDRPFSPFFSVTSAALTQNFQTVIMFISLIVIRLTI